MPDLYIANCSKQDFNFTYMLIENSRPFLQRIRAGGQIKIPCQMGEEQQIIKQHEPYSFQEASKVAKGFSGQCYRIDKPISLDAIENGFAQRDQEMIDRAAQARAVGAAATDHLITEKATEFGVHTKGGVEVQVTEEGKNPTDTAGKFDETISVSKDAPDMPPQRRAGGRRR